MNSTENIIGFAVSRKNICMCIKQIQGWLNDQGGSRYLVCANPHSLVNAQSDPAFHKAIENADLVSPDGSGIVIASRILGGDISRRVTGSDIFSALSEHLNYQPGSSYYFLGSTPQVLNDIQNKMAIDYPNIRISGTWSPPFKTEFSEYDNNVMIEKINAAKPDVLWVGMTAPKQEKWIHQHRDQLDVKFIGAIGAVFDFYAGNVKRSHPVFQRLGLEWLPRLLADPKRLWRRMGVSAPIFLWRVLQQRLGVSDKINL